MIYLVRLWPAPGLRSDQVEAILNQEQDWIRFDEMTWLVRSRRFAQDLHLRLAPLVQNGRHLVMQVDKRNTQGGMTQPFWDWVNKPELP